MWFFMQSIYVLSLFSFLLLITAFFQSFLQFSVLQANHLTFMVLTSIIYLFTETLAIFFFVGTGVSVKEFMLKQKITGDYHKKSIAIKRKVYPPLLLNMLFMIILFIMVGAVDTGHVPAWTYYGLFVFCIGHYVKIKVIEHQSFIEMTENILAMSGVTRKGESEVKIES